MRHTGLRKFGTGEHRPIASPFYYILSTINAAQKSCQQFEKHCRGQDYTLAISSDHKSCVNRNMLGINTSDFSLYVGELPM